MSIPLRDAPLSGLTFCQSSGRKWERWEERRQVSILPNLVVDKGRLHIGTSGWHYDHWRGPFYPTDLSKTDFLSFYARRLETTEINNSFYHLPKAGTFGGWRDKVDAVSDEFIFAVKASRYITHLKKLKDPAEPLRNLYERIDYLEDKLGPILFQLPPNWRFNGERLAAFVETLSRNFRHAFEFRDPTWFNERTYDILSRHQSAFCIYELAGLQSPREVTADFVYIRLHGPGEAYEGSYDTQSLTGWIGALSTWSRQGRDVYCYFDNDEKGYAVQNAIELAGMAHSG